MPCVLAVTGMDITNELLASLKHAVHWHDQLTPADIARYEAVIARASIAPNMLAVLKQIAGNGDGKGRNPQLMVDAALAAVAEAEGKS